MTSPQQPESTDDLSILPLPLEPFEEYLVRDERPGYPMVFPLVLCFKGSIDRQKFEQALTDTLAYEPLLTALVTRRFRRFKWVPCSRTMKVEWNEEMAPSDPTEGMVETPAIDLQREPGLKITATAFPETVRITFNFHHACTDGVGANRFIGNVMARYGELLDDGQGLATKPPQPQLLTQRNELDIVLPEPLTVFQTAKAILKESITWLSQRPVPLAVKSAGNADQNGQIILWKPVNKEFFDLLREQAQSAGVGLNDLLIRDLFYSVRDWNAACGNSKPSNLIRLLIPTNLRKSCHRQIPSANIMGYGFLGRTVADCQDADEAAFLKGISDEMRFIREWSLGSLFLSGLQLFQSLPGALRRLTSDRTCHATCVLSNLGPFHATLSQSRFRREKTIRVGDLSLENIIGAPPVRPNTLVSMAVIIHDGTLSVASAFDLSRVTHAEANRFIEQYLDRLKQTAQNSSPSPIATQPAQPSFL